LETIAKTGRAIIEIEKNSKKCIISIKRTKIRDGKEYIYYTLPGGHVENEESFEETTIREVNEELGIDIRIDEEFAHVFNKDLNKDEKFFICTYLKGTIGTGTGPEFTNYNLELYGKYDIEYIEVIKISEYNLLPIYIKNMLIEKYNKYN
jgi:8-oxo-dGTP pyrophosphatase MutT (NUDIX family)